MRPESVSRCAIVLLASLAILAAGCASKPQVVPSSGPREPTTAAQVKMYSKAPKKYEALGAVAVPIGGDVRWDERGDADAGFERLKADAAARGANGLLLQAPPEQADSQVLAGYKGDYYQVPMKANPRTAVAQAIYVLQEK